MVGYNSKHCPKGYWEGCKKYDRNERLCKHKKIQMEKVIPSFEYEPLVLSPKLKTSYEEEDRGDIHGVRP
jgi:hypothetical protein